MELRAWQSLAEDRHEELVREGMGVRAGDVAGIARLRKMCADAEVVRAALMLGEARRKGVGKFGAARAAGLWADPAGVEMATSVVVAEHKAARFGAGLAARPGMDLCCGIGGDAMALATALKLAAVDRDPVRAWMAGINAGCRAVCADATTIELADGPVHIDPARRTDRGARVWRSEDLRPRLADVRAILGRARWGGAVKLGPGADLAEIERELPGCSIEVISERGTLVQAVAWCGESLRTAGGVREATLIARRIDGPPVLDQGAWTISGSADAGELPVHSPEFRAARYVYEPDDSVERAGLLGVLCEKLGAAMLHPRAGLLTSDAVIESPWVRGFEVLAEMPWNLKRVKAALEERGAGIVEVKTRGVDVNADEMQGSLRGKGSAPLTVFVARLGPEMRGIVARRLKCDE